MTTISIEDIYELSPVQSGILFHCVCAPNSGLYVEQMIFRLRGQIHYKAFERAWQRVVARHCVLRTSFHWEQLDNAVQSVHRSASLPIEHYDWRSQPAMERQTRLEAFLDADRRRGFELSQPPLMRLALIRIEDNVYELIWSHHHLLLDGWSTAWLLKEVGLLYESFYNGKNVRLEPSRRYGDYIGWLQEQDLGSAEKFWRQELRGFVAPTPLVVERAPRGLLTESQEHRELQLALCPLVTERLYQMARENQLTVNSVVQAAWALLLSRYSGSHDIVFGVTVSGRPPALAGVESMVGVFINTLPARVSVPPNAILRSWLRELHNHQAEVRQFEHCPLVKIHEWSELPGDLPLFESILIFEKFPEMSRTGGQQTFEVEDVRSFERTNYPLLIQIGPGLQLSIKITYDCQRFANAVIDRMLGHLQNLLTAMTVSSTQRLSELHLTDQAERHQMLVDWNDTHSPYPDTLCLHELFEQTVERLPERVAVISGHELVTYATLNRRANQLAHYLRKAGVGPESAVGIYMNRSVDLFVSLLAVLKSGGMYIPLDPTYPRDRLRFMLEDANATVLLTHGGLPNPTSDSQGLVVTLDSQGPEIALENDMNPVRVVTANHLAYIMYTSGSTGKPKGATLKHHSAVALIEWSKDLLTDDELQGFLASTSICFDSSILEIFVPLSRGGTIILAENAMQLPALPEADYVTVVNTVPSAIAELLHQCRLPRSVRVVSLAGEPLQGTLVQQIYRDWRVEKVVNLYGLSEDTTYTTSAWLEKDSAEVVSIGRPIANRQVYILDRNGEPLPVGVPGELYVGGIGLAREYLHRPRLTADRFVPNPFSRQAGERLYRTGDLAQYQSDGRIQFLGRIDNQVKLRGMRIEPGEIETVLAGHSAIRDAVVLIREDTSGEKGLVGYVVWELKGDTTLEDLRAYVQSRLPSYMVPGVFMELEALPLTPNGKLDRRSLPAPDPTGANREKTFVAPSGPVEETLSKIWGKVLGLDHVGADDDFLALGGHSLRAMQATSRIREVFDVELSPAEILEHRTIARVARRLVGLRAGRGLQAPPLVRVSRQEGLPLSFAQQRLWFLDQMEPENPYYNISITRRLRGPLDINVLERSLGEIVRRHEVLRTTIIAAEHQSRQVVGPPNALTLPLIDLQQLPAHERENEAWRGAGEEACRTFDLAHGPLFRVTLLRIGEKDHVILLTMHHIIADAWSIEVLIKEVSTLYSTFCRGLPSALTELKIQYADYAVWQRMWLQGESLDGQLSYWKAQLEGAPQSLELLTDRPRPAVQSFRGASKSVLLSASLLEQLNALGQREGSTLFMTMLAAFCVLLHRWTGQQDILVGTPITGRNRAELEPLIGFFVNTLVMRADMRGDPSYYELLARVREMALGAYTHQDLPFEKLVDELDVERDLSRTPLFQVMFILRNAPLEVEPFLELTLNHLNLEPEIAKFDLTLSLSETEHALRGTLGYNTDLFDPETIERMLAQFERLLEGVVANPDQRLSQSPLLSDAEQKKLLVEWNDTKVPYPQDACIHELFEAQVEKTPDQVALVFENEQLTYRELNCRANRFAHYLCEQGVGPEALVGVCLERSLEMVVGILGTLKAGTTYVPLDPEYPKERLAFILADSRVAVLLTQQRLQDRLPEHPIQRICLDSDWDKIAAVSSDRPLPAVAGESAACVLYTSGSTGEPKGVLTTHQGIVNRLYGMQDSYGLQGDDRVLQKTPVTFDVSIWEFFWPLMSGATLVIAQPKAHRDPGLLKEIIVAEGITTLHFVPTMMQAFLDQPAAMTSTPLRRVLCGGEALSTDMKERFLSRYPGVELYHLYGPTEAAIDVTTTTLLQRGDQSRIPIGRTVANTQIYLLESTFRPAPIGVSGELHIGGVQLAQGYLHRPQLTAEKFVPNPFADQPGSRLYRSGDLCRYLKDGNIEFLGRRDHQVKIRGFRIELGEIETLLHKHAAVRQVVVLARQDPPGVNRLVAYVVLKDGAAPRTSEFRSYLQEQLPDYMVPSAFVTLDSFPLTSSGKTDRRSLPAPDQTRNELEEAFVAPRSPHEEMLVDIWSQVLGVERVGVHDNFFELGGHSILATQVVSRVRNAFEMDLPLRALFETPTVAGIAEHVKKATSGGESFKSHPLVCVNRDGALPLSFAQERLWFLDRLEPDSHAYNIPSGLRLIGLLNVRALERAFGEIVRRHEVLRTRLLMIDGRAVQKIDATEKFSFQFVDLSKLPAVTRLPESRRLADKETKRPFDLAHGPLMRTTLARLNEQEHVVILTLHHVVADGWSMRVLADELFTLYDTFSLGSPSPLSELSIQYADYAVWQREWLKDEALDEQLCYWKAQLQGVPQLIELPADRPRPAVQGFRGASETFVLPANLLDQLKALGQREGTTLFMTMLAAFYVSLYRWTGQQDILVGTPIAGRNRAEIEPLIGFFINTLVMRGDMHGNPSFCELLARVREMALGAYAHQDLPFEKLVDELEVVRDLRRTPLFQVMFILQNAQLQMDPLSELTLTPLDMELGTAKFDLTFGLAETEQGLRGTLDYNTDLFDPPKIQRFLTHFERLVEGFVSNPKQRLSEFPLLTDAEQTQLLVEWNDTQAAYAHEGCFHELFESQVEKSPDQVALIYEQHQLTYEELNVRANQLAHYLRKRGVGPGGLVGVCLERSLEMVVGILGILKAGAAYIPLDPEYPQERLDFILEDTKVSVLLTQQRLQERLPEQEVLRICLDLDWDQIAREAPGNPGNVVTGSHLSHIIYTSGSTGRPKGVAIEHRSVTTLLNWSREHFSDEDLAGVLASTSICFDLSVWELFVPLSWGGMVILARNVLQLPALSSAGRVTLINTVPSAMAQLLRLGGVPGSVRTVNLAGELLKNDLVERIYELHGIERVCDLYGPSEDTTYSTFAQRSIRGPATIGRPIANTQVYLLSKELQPVSLGVAGELHLGGAGLASGYLNRPGLTAERFVPNPFSQQPGTRIYKTGDLARYLPDGNLALLGRMDHQVKIRGFRIELGEIEMVLGQCPGVQECVVVASEDQQGEKRLVAYLVAKGEQRPGVAELRRCLKEKLPDYMVPSAVVFLSDFPRTSGGKVNRSALQVPAPSRPDLDEAFVAPRTALEDMLARIWSEVVGVERVGIHDNFFELGGNSLLLVQVHVKLRAEHDHDLTVVDLFKYPTIDALARYLGDSNEEEDLVHTAKERVKKRNRAPAGDGRIAIIGMSGRFPGARNLESFWTNLRNGVESIRFFTDEELKNEGVDDELLSNPNYVKARGVLDDVELFDAAYFDFSPKEAELTDPQHRLFLECAHEALERAGYDPQRYPGMIGVYAGSSLNSYMGALLSIPELWKTGGTFQAVISNDKDFLSTRVSYKLNLRGPSMSVQTACSTSLVAVHEACRSLLNHECDMALSGGVSVSVPMNSGYMYQKGGIASPDGHCRPFDAEASGMLGGSGVGVVVLKRLDEAISDGDVVHAVILGSAINNDGSMKVSYTAPSVQGQAEVIAMAQASAGVNPQTIGYVEAHGTGTALGDPIEVAALKQVFGTSPRSAQAQSGIESGCALGAVKSNIGHLDAAAGVAGLIKTVLCLKYRELVPSLHFEHPNPEIDFGDNQFYVSTENCHWAALGDHPRRAAVSSFGIGGTNAHAVLEESPRLRTSGRSRDWQLLVLSAKTDAALELVTSNIGDHLGKNSHINLADAAYTLQVGRQQHNHRRIILCHDAESAVASLEGQDPRFVCDGVTSATHQPVAFLFPGQGSQYVNMGLGLYRNERVFRHVVDECSQSLKTLVGFDLRDVLYPESDGNSSVDNTLAEETSIRLMQTSVAQPALFVVELALARLWMSWGIMPTAMIGHNIGEFVAACVSGVLTQDDALQLVALRGKLMEGSPPGSILEVQMVEPFVEAMARVNLQEPQIPYISSVSGTWMKAEEACDPDYWGRQICESVLFADGAAKLLEKDAYLCLEVGPGNTLCELLNQQRKGVNLSSLRAARDINSDGELMGRALGRLWVAGAAIDWEAYYGDENRRRVELPTYPFERKRYWVDRKPKTGDVGMNVVPFDKKTDLSDWFYIPSWKRSPRQVFGGSLNLGEKESCCLVFTDSCGLAAKLCERLEELGEQVVTVAQGQQFSKSGHSAYVIDPREPEQYDALIKAVRAQGIAPHRVIHVWTVTPEPPNVPVPCNIDEYQNIGFYSLLYLAQALGKQCSDPLEIMVVSNQIHDVFGEEVLCPEKATVLGPCQVIPLEYPNLRCRHIDVVFPNEGRHQLLVDQLLAEYAVDGSDRLITFRGNHRLVKAYEPIRLDRSPDSCPRLRANGVYLITGGLGGIGLVLAEHLARKVKAKLILTGRSQLPPRESWDQWLSTHEVQDPISRKLRQLRTIEALGAEVFPLNADVASKEQMQAAIAEAEKRFGRIQGAIHAAGLPDGALISRRTRETSDTVLLPKVHGTVILEQLLKDRQLDFLVLCSSLSSVLAPIGQVAYCAANAFLDAFAFHKTTRDGTFTVSINWDSWQQVGMAVEAAGARLARSLGKPISSQECTPSLGEHRVATKAAEQTSRLVDEALQHGLLPTEGIEVFDRILTLTSPQVLVSTLDLPQRLQSRDTSEVLGVTNESQKQTGHIPFHPRPDLDTHYVAPSNEIEECVAEVWGELFGIDRIGINDDFFELGGDSLLAIQLMSRLRDSFGIELGLDSFFATPKVAELSNHIIEKLAEQVMRLGKSPIVNEGAEPFA